MYDIKHGKTPELAIATTCWSKNALVDPQQHLRVIRSPRRPALLAFGLNASGGPTHRLRELGVGQGDALGALAKCSRAIGPTPRAFPAVLTNTGS